MTGEILTGLLIANLAFSLAILVVLVLRQPARRLIGARGAYALWLGVPVAALALLVPRPSAMPGLPAAAAGDLGAAFRWPLFDAGAAPAPTAAGAGLVLLLVWLVGAVIFMALALRAHRTGVARFGTLTPDGSVLRAQNAGAGPALIGGFRPKLVIPSDFERRFSPREQFLVLEHERTHLAAGDTAINTLIVLFTAVNWFNPLVHLAAFCVRVDQELACDAAVAARFPGERRTYARALLKSQLAPAPLPLGCYWPGRSSKLLTERIDMLAFKTTPIRRIAGALTCLAVCSGLGFAAWAAAPAQDRTPTAAATATSPAVSAAIAAGDGAAVIEAGGQPMDVIAALRVRADQRRLPLVSPRATPNEVLDWFADRSDGSTLRYEIRQGKTYVARRDAQGELQGDLSFDPNEMTIPDTPAGHLIMERFGLSF